MKLIKVIETYDKDKFEMYSDNLTSQGFILSSCSCGFVNDEKYDYCSVYQAIFTRREEDIKPMSDAFSLITECCKNGCEYWNNPKGCTQDGQYIKLIPNIKYIDSFIIVTHDKDGVWIESCVKDKDAITIAQYKNSIKV